MAIGGYSLLLGLIVLASSLAPVEPITCRVPKTSLNRHSFPTGFVFGTATSAYQIEGEANKSGRGPSVWDHFTHKYPEKIADRNGGDMTIDFYHLYEEDIKRMKAMNMDAFRFSISWSRLIPSGNVRDKVNVKGIDFYNKLIDTLISNGLKPFVTLFHWDTPQALEDEYGGFLNRNIVNNFREFADLCFQLFGERVKYWITLNEPWAYSAWGYDRGIFAPGRCSKWVNQSCPGAQHKTCTCEAGNSATEPYIVAHNLLLAHAAAVKLYREKYQARQNGSIGITINSFWYEPASKGKVDEEAVKRILDFEYGWYMDPITFGHYPKNMRKLVGSRLPTFTSEESKNLKGSYDFLGLNYYSAYFAAGIKPHPNQVRYTTDSHVNATSIARNGNAIGPKAGVGWFYVFPEGMRRLLNYTKNTYMNPTIYITENGFADTDDGTLSLEQALNDTCRTKYYVDHTNEVYESIKNDNVTIKGYFAWSYADNFEWASGYTVRFGLTYINYTDLSRHPKISSNWFANFLEHKGKNGGLI